MNKIIIIGDSFCGKMDWVRPQPNETKSFWPDVLKDKFVDYQVIVDSYPSRDIQTIIENWIRVIKHLKENDFLIMLDSKIKIEKRKKNTKKFIANFLTRKY